MNTSIFDVAKYIMNELEQCSKWKLHKLCYYCQAWSLVWDEVPLFKEDFYAWGGGAVCIELDNFIPNDIFLVTKDLFENIGDTSNLTDYNIETIDIVINDYGDKEPWWLTNLIKEELPWKEARTGLPPGEKGHSLISKEVIQNYYASL